MARRGSRVATEEEEVELNMTPMLDVVFILLIFFIVTSVFIKEPGIDPVRPEALTQDSLNPSMLVAVNSENEIWIDRRVYEQAELQPIIEQLLQENPKARATIQGDEEADIGIILDVQDLLIENGVEVTISTLQE